MHVVGKIDLLQLGVGPSSCILDLGCSSGTQAVELAQRGFRTVGLDNDPTLAARCAQTAREKGVAVPVLVADAAHLPYASEAFDAVISTEVFEHLPDPEAAAREVYRVLRPGGRFCFAVPTARTERIFRRIHPHWVEDSGHIQLFDSERVLTLLTEAGFRVNHVEHHNFEWTLFWILHSALRSRFDFTGTPLKHTLASRVFFRVWNWVMRTPIGPAVLREGNVFLGKSVYVYAIRD